MVKTKKIKSKDLREYNRQYYLKNKERLLAKKRERYHNDPNYKNLIVESVKKRYENIRKKKLVERLNARLLNFDEGIDVKNYKAYRLVYYKGEKIPFYSASSFAKIIGVSVTTINNWHKLNVLRKPNYIELTTNKKWYSKKFIMNVIQGLKNSKSASLDDLREAFKEVFSKNPDVGFDGKSVLTKSEREFYLARFGNKNGDKDN